MSDPADSQPVLFRALLPSARAPVRTRDILDALAFEDRASSQTRPYLVLNMVSSTDGRATIGGRSGPLGNRADNELFHGLRSTVDAVMVGAQTLRVERYDRIVKDPRRRKHRREQGLDEEPYACVVSASLQFDPAIALLHEQGARVVILTPSEGEVSHATIPIKYIRANRDGALDLAAAIGQLRERCSVRTLLCEGGPHLNSQLLRAGLVDELFLCLAPKLAGQGTAPDTLSIVAGMELKPPIELELIALFESESHLFLRYRVHNQTQSS